MESVQMAALLVTRPVQVYHLTARLSLIKQSNIFRFLTEMVKIFIYLHFARFRISCVNINLTFYVQNLIFLYCYILDNVYRNYWWQFFEVSTQLIRWQYYQYYYC